MLNRKMDRAVIAALAVAAASLSAFAVDAPPTEQVNQATADITSQDAQRMNAAVTKIRAWVKTTWVPQDLWRTWLPALKQAGRYQQVADIALEGILARPGAKEVTPLFLLRIRALLALNENDAALQAAKSCYNDCEYKTTPEVVLLVAECLTRASGTDKDLGAQFKAEQVAASLPLAQGEQNPLSGTPAILKSIIIDATPYENEIDKRQFKTNRPIERCYYANMLLIGDRAADAEVVFRDVFMNAATQEDYVMAAEGVAKALRAEDGTIARSNAFLASIQPTASMQAMVKKSPPPARPTAKEQNLP